MATLATGALVAAPIGQAASPRWCDAAAASRKVCDRSPWPRAPNALAYQLACSRSCRVGCQAAYAACTRQSRNWARCGAERRRCLRSCGC